MRVLREGSLMSSFLKIGVLMLLVSSYGCSRNPGGRSDTEVHGRALFILNCSPCHEESNPQLKVQPPRLNGIFAEPRLPSGAPATDDQVRKTIIEGRGIMPAFDQRLTKDDVTDTLNYLHTLK